jgi:hypothetical protein
VHRVFSAARRRQRIRPGCSRVGCAAGCRGARRRVYLRCWHAARRRMRLRHVVLGRRREHANVRRARRVHCRIGYRHGAYALVGGAAGVGAHVDRDHVRTMACARNQPRDIRRRGVGNSSRRAAASRPSRGCLEGGRLEMAARPVAAGRGRSRSGARQHRHAGDRWSSLGCHVGRTGRRRRRPLPSRRVCLPTLLL